MTREVAKELLPVIQAFADGKNIEYSKDGELWLDTNTPTWDTDYVYRIKSEPEYRPFQTQEEYLEEMSKHNEGSWVKHKTGDTSKHIFKIKEDIGGNPWFLTTSLSGVELFSAKKMFDYFEFMDGTPFGIKKE